SSLRMTLVITLLKTRAFSGCKLFWALKVSAISPTSLSAKLKFSKSEPAAPFSYFEIPIPKKIRSGLPVWLQLVQVTLLVCGSEVDSLSEAVMDKSLGPGSNVTCNFTSWTTASVLNLIEAFGLPLTVIFTSVRGELYEIAVRSTIRFASSTVLSFSLGTAITTSGGFACALVVKLPASTKGRNKAFRYCAEPS